MLLVFFFFFGERRNKECNKSFVLLQKLSIRLKFPNWWSFIHFSSFPYITNKFPRFYDRKTSDRKRRWENSTERRAGKHDRKWRTTVGLNHKFSVEALCRRDRIVVSTLRCGRNNPGSNPGHGTLYVKLSSFFSFFSLFFFKSFHFFPNDLMKKKLLF